jgi:hypothetical protein
MTKRDPDHVDDTVARDLAESHPAITGEGEVPPIRPGDNGEGDIDAAAERARFVTATLKSNGFIYLVTEFRGIVGKALEMPVDVAEVIRDYLLEKRDATELKDATQGAVIGDKMDAELGQLEAFIRFRRELDEVADRADARAELRAGTKATPRRNR